MPEFVAQKQIEEPLFYKGELTAEETQMLEQFFSRFREKIVLTFKTIHHTYKHHSIFKPNNISQLQEDIKTIKDNPVCLKRSKTEKRVLKDSYLNIDTLWRFFLRFSKKGVQFHTFKVNMFLIGRNMVFEEEELKDIVFQMFFLHSGEELITDLDKLDFLDSINHFLNQKLLIKYFSSKEEAEEFLKDKKKADLFEESVFLAEKQRRIDFWARQMIHSCLEQIFPSPVFQEKQVAFYQEV